MDATPQTYRDDIAQARAALGNIQCVEWHIRRLTEKLEALEQALARAEQERAGAQSRERAAAHTITWERGADGRARFTLCDTGEVLSQPDDGRARLGELILEELRRVGATCGTVTITVQPVQDAGEQGR